MVDNILYNGVREQRTAETPCETFCSFLRDYLALRRGAVPVTSFEFVVNRSRSCTNVQQYTYIYIYIYMTISLKCCDPQRINNYIVEVRKTINTKYGY